MSSQGSGRSGDGDRDPDNEASGDFNTYSDLHRYMLQGMIYAGILDAKGVKGLFNGSCIHTNHRCAESEKLANIQKVVLAINSRIKDFNMAIKTATCELTAKKYYTFVMTIEDPMAKFQKTFTSMELDMFMHCMDVILRKTDTFTVSEADCVRIALEKDTSSKKFSLTSADLFVQKMLNMLYFIECPGPILDGPAHITLGPRTMKEFECVLRESYQEAVIKCCLCLHPLLHGWMCPNKSVCKNVVHLSCYKNFQNHSVDCPGCQAPWIPMSRLIRRVKEIVEGHDAEETETDVEIEGLAGTDADAEPPVVSLKSLTIGSGSGSKSKSKGQGSSSDDSNDSATPMETDAVVPESEVVIKEGKKNGKAPVPATATRQTRTKRRVVSSSEESD